MNMIVNDLFKLWDEGKIIAVTTNGCLRKTNAGVMGAGIALLARNKFPGIEEELGKQIRSVGNHVALIHDRVYSLPTKHHWKDASPLDLVVRSICELNQLAGDIEEKIYIPRPGCQNGRLNWLDVRMEIEPHMRNLVLVERSY